MGRNKEEVRSRVWRHLIRGLPTLPQARGEDTPAETPEQREEGTQQQDGPVGGQQEDGCLADPKKATPLISQIARFLSFLMCPKTILLLPNLSHTIAYQ